MLGETIRFDTTAKGLVDHSYEMGVRTNVAFDDLFVLQVLYYLRQCGCGIDRVSGSFTHTTIGNIAGITFTV